MDNLLKLIVVLFIVGLVLIAGPWCLIWAVNTIALEAGWIVAAKVIPFTFWTWLAAVLLGGLAIIPSSRRS